MKSQPAAADREVMIQAEHLARYYGPSPALRDITFTAYRGEIVGFLGPNGAGKTTTMRILTGYLPPTSGKASIAGYDIIEQSMDARRHVGYLPETTPLYTDMTVWSYLDFMARLRGVADRDEAVERAMSRVSLQDRADQLIGQLSKGLRQRVGIAQAVLHDPPVVILDEPTIGLDPRQIQDVRGLIQELKGNHTVIISTHILSEAEQLCDRVLVINRGEIVAAASPAELRTQLAGADAVRVVVPSSVRARDVEQALKAVDGVAEVANEGEGRYVVKATAGASPRPAIAQAVVGNGWPLMELTPLGMSLERIFLELTAESGADPDDEMLAEEDGDA
ncbi:MAG: ABC transporter ATP-binding protein [Ardenticatenales bacterium]